MATETSSGAAGDAMTTGAKGLVVPVDLLAFCVGQADAVQGTTAFSGATVDYGALQQVNVNAYMGASATRPLSMNPLHSLEQGVHLHWALPDALTRGTTSTGQPLAFPAVPNRWLVTRFLIQGTTITPASFVVESDTFSATAPTTHIAPLIPTRQSGTSVPGFAYMGQRADLDGYQARVGAGAYADGVGSPFTAVANGLHSFASFYPESRASFGFVDTLSGITGDVQLHYVVTGWYDDASDDPASIVAKRAASAPAGTDPLPGFASSYRWSGAEAGDAPGYTLYSGTVQGVAWNPSTQYVSTTPPSIKVDAAVGNSPAEALSAYFTATQAPGNTAFEQLLTAFQQGQWNNLIQPGSGGRATLAERLHTTQFGRLDSSLIWTVFQTRADGSQAEAIALPRGIADALNRANIDRQQALAVTAHVETFKWQMFADWYRYFAVADAAEQSVVFNHVGGTLMPAWGDATTGLQGAYATATAASKASDAALAEVVALRPDLSLREVPGPRYWQPADPVLLLTGDPGLNLSPRYGGDADAGAIGSLACRPTDQIIAAVAIGSASRSATDYAAATRLTSNMLPYLADCEALLAEALLLDTSLASGWSGVAPVTLQTALGALLGGGTQSQWTLSAGTAPSPVELNWWAGANPWIPLFLEWQSAFVPLQPTIAGGAAADYDPGFFLGNYTIDPDTGSFLAYTPSDPHGITIDPAKQDYSHPSYTGQTILSGKAAANLSNALAAYLPTHPDPTLQAIETALGASPFVAQPLSGFTAGLTNRVLQVQAALVAPSAADQSAQIITGAAASVIGSSYDTGVDINTPYNPIRAGYFKMSATAVDAFGQRRAVQIGKLYTAESMTTVVGGATVPGIAYAAPRLAQPSRLLFEWMSAGSVAIAEMTRHPAASPVCGWLMPDHLTRGFFVYDAPGRPLGMLQLDGAGAVRWQGAPGDDADIDLPVAAAMAGANPLLASVVLALAAGTCAFFEAFYAAVDAAHGSINPANLQVESGLSVLAGRPVALAQAALRLDLRGRPYLNQNAALLDADSWTDTENGLSAVRFPVMLGDIDRLDDGLVGFFRQAQGNAGFALDTFFSGAADPSSTSGVVVPTADTLQLTLTPTYADADPPAVDAETTRVLMLVDPRAPIHAVTGILPTETLAVPSDLAAAALSSLELYFLAAPVLRGPSVLALPVPTLANADVSFAEQTLAAGTLEWRIEPDIAAPVSNAMWHYTPQSLTEGWLRINPTQLGFGLAAAAGKPAIPAGQTQDLILTLTNAKPNALTFTPGVLAAEGTPAKGSILYLHLGALVADADADVAALVPSLAGWSFQQFSDAVYGAYWAATPAADVTLAPGATLTAALAGVKVTASAGQLRCSLDYYAVEGAADGVFTAAVTVSPKS